MDLSARARFDDYWPPDFGWGARDPRDDPGLIVPFSFAGVVFQGGVHRDFVPLLRGFLQALVPRIPGGLQGPCGCYNPKSVTGNGTRSFHTWGIAVDLNWQDNPMGVPNRPGGPLALPAETGAIARRFGLEWGGDWTSPKDWMHVECHVPPGVARSFTPAPAAAPNLLEQLMALDPNSPDYKRLVNDVAAATGQKLMTGMDVIPSDDPANPTYTLEYALTRIARSLDRIEKHLGTQS